jgi:two-component system sensor histidine kinase PilS (NtrC family)
LASVLSGRITSAKNELIENAELTQRLIDDHDQILNQVPAGIVTVDAMGAIDSVNPAAFEILGPVLGRQLSDVLPGQGRRWEHVHARGTQRRFLLCNQTTRRQGGYVVAIEDVTRMRQIEAELAREERLAAVGRLAAGLAHEIRNPLASLSGAVQLLGEKSEAPLFDIVLREVHRINELVEEFLDTARPLKLSIAQVDITSLVNGVVGAFRNDPRYRDRVAIHVDCEGITEPVGADASRLSQVLWNLLLNAAQSSPGPCRVEVTAATVDRSLELEVKDDGPGIPPESQERIFDPFFTTRSGGTGLGLANVHRIVRAHGGTVEVESEVGHGARFILRFPLAPEQNLHEITDVKVEVRPHAR